MTDEDMEGKRNPEGMELIKYSTYIGNKQDGAS